MLMVVFRLKSQPLLLGLLLVQVGIKRSGR